MRREISAASGNELFFIGVCAADGMISEVEVVARGNRVGVPAIMSRASAGDIVIHNHPSGDLAPSDADLDVASIAGNGGRGFYITNNDCTRCYVVVTPYSERKGEFIPPEEIGSIFGAEGLLARKLKGFEKRDEQMKMSLAVSEAFNNDRVLLVEAGTGTGKSLAYLVPAIIWALRNNERVMISTNTINLQEQLIKKELPFLARHYDSGLKAVLVKGRKNYACLRKLEMAETEPSLFPDDSSAGIADLIEWSRNSCDGSLSDLPFHPKHGAWDDICCEADQCGRSRCRHFNFCFLYRARREAAAARIVVANHSILLSDIVLRKESGYEAAAILPPFSRLLLDEAHHLEDAATTHFSITVSRGIILKQLGRLVPPRGSRAALFGILSDRLARYLGDSDEAIYMELSGMIETLLMPKCGDIAHLAETVFDGMGIDLAPLLNGFAGNERKLRITPEIEQGEFWRGSLCRLKKLSDDIGDFASAIRALVSRCRDMPEKTFEKISDQLIDIQGIEKRLQKIAADILFCFSEADGFCRWIEAKRERSSTQVMIHAAPFDVSREIRENILDRLKTVVLTSATLAVGGSFGYFKKRAGLDLLEKSRLAELRLPSPFDYASQVFAASPDDMPEPSETGFIPALQEAIIRSVAITGGGAFILFTSYDLLNKVYSGLSPEMEKMGLQTLKQGEGNRHALLARFRKSGNSVLFGVDSFWEGVDVKGDALRLVIITRLPFHVPTEPVQQARAERIKADGGDPFREFSIPQAVIKFRQGFGRLVRSRNDRGGALILDRRISTRWYGRIFIRSLPETEFLTGGSGEIFSRMESFFTPR